MGIATFTFTRTGSTAAPLTINFSVGGSAQLNVDYTVSAFETYSSTGGSAVILAGATFAQATVSWAVDSGLTVALGLNADSDYAVTTTGGLIVSLGNGGGGTLEY